MTRWQVADGVDAVSGTASDEVGDHAGPAGLVGGAEPGAVVAVEVLVEEQVVVPRRVALQALDVAEARPPAVGAPRKSDTSRLAEVLGDLVERALAAADPVGYSIFSSSPKKRW